MKTIGMPAYAGETAAQTIQRRSVVRQALLLLGILSPLLYAVTDVAGGMRYDGYSFRSQGISELMAIGAASKPVC